MSSFSLVEFKIKNNKVINYYKLTVSLLTTDPVSGLSPDPVGEGRHFYRQREGAGGAALQIRIRWFQSKAISRESKTIKLVIRIRCIT